jgi:plastocyanin
MRTSTAVLSRVGLASLAVAAVALVAFAAPASPASQTNGQRLTFTIAGPHGTERVSPSGNIAIAPGVPVTVTVTNYTRETHSFTIPALGISRVIMPAGKHGARKTTFTFTSTRSGSFRWYCVFCVDGKHGQKHSMGGSVWSIIDPSILP